VKKFPQISNKLTMLYCRAEMAHDRTWTISVIGFRKHSVDIQIYQFLQIFLHLN